MDSITHIQTLLAAKPEDVQRAETKLGEALQAVRRNPQASKHFRETAAMSPVPPPPVPGMNQPGSEPLSSTDSAILRSLMEMAKSSGSAEGRAVTKFQISLLTGVLGILWAVTLALIGAIWGDQKAGREKSDLRIEKVEGKVQEIQQDISVLQAHDVEKDKTLNKMDARQEVLIQKVDELKDEVRKPR
jgi:hypothetical protein